MAVIHILKDGTRVDSIRGHVVKMADAAPLYAMIDKMNTRAAARPGSSAKTCAGK